MKTSPYFRPRWSWVTADLQTIRNVFPGRLTGILPNSGQRFEIPLRDESGDRLVARFHKGRKPVPTVVLVPGLVGCEASRYVLQSAGAWLASGAPIVRLNLRGSPPGRSIARSHHHMGRVRDLADACLAVAGLDPGIRDGHRVSVSKNLLLETLAGGFETGALTIAHDLPLKGALVTEIGSFELVTTAAGNLVLHGAGKGHHADMAVALALAYFASEKLVGGCVGEYRLAGWY